MSTVLCRDVYSAALALLSEPQGDDSAARRTDYDERAPYLLAAMCDEARAIDAAYRSASGEDAQPEFSPVCLEMYSSFPLTSRFAAPASAYLAAMLVLDENESLSDTLYSRYCDLMSELCAACPATSHPIVDVYGFN